MQPVLLPDIHIAFFKPPSEIMKRRYDVVLPHTHVGKHLDDRICEIAMRGLKRETPAVFFA